MKWSGKNKIIEDQGNVRENLILKKSQGKLKLFILLEAEAGGHNYIFESLLLSGKGELIFIGKKLGKVR